MGDHLGARGEGERVVTHQFACLRPGYPGWYWSVTITRAKRAKDLTVNEVVLLPGGDAIVAPAWVPYKERIKPGDLSPGDLLPVEEDDERLVPTYAVGEDDDLSEDDVRRLVDDHTTGRALGTLGEPAVDVLELNIAVRAAAGS